MQTLGLNLLIADLARAAATIKPRAEKVEESMAAAVAATWRGLAPRVTGEYADSIESEGNEAYATARHAPFVEFGTSDTAPQPAMGPATDRHTPEFVENIAEIGADI